MITNENWGMRHVRSRMRQRIALNTNENSQMTNGGEIMAKYLFRITKTTEAYIEESDFTEIKAMRKAEDRFYKILEEGIRDKDYPHVETEIVQVDRDTYEPID